MALVLRAHRVVSVTSRWAATLHVGLIRVKVIFRRNSTAFLQRCIDPKPSLLIQRRRHVVLGKMESSWDTLHSTLASFFAMISSNSSFGLRKGVQHPTGPAKGRVRQALGTISTSGSQL